MVVKVNKIVTPSWADFAVFKIISPASLKPSGSLDIRSVAISTPNIPNAVNIKKTSGINDDKKK